MDSGLICYQKFVYLYIKCGFIMIIYASVHLPTQKYYIGKTTKKLNTRIKQHYNDAKCTASTYFHKSLIKYPENEFKWICIKKSDDKNSLNKSEIFYINFFKNNGFKLFNLTNGGDGGSRPGRMNPAYGKKVNQKVKNKISKSLKDYYSKNEATFLGKKHTDKTKELISKGKKGFPLLRARGKRSSITGKNNPSAKKIKCVTTNEIFEYAKLASIKYNSDLSSIIKCCKGKVNSVKGKKYEYC
jgi:group I intron endonuclease